MIDERTVRYNLSEPAPYSLANMASLFCGIVDVNEVERIGEWEFNRHPVMNGEYAVEEWVAGSHLTLKRNEYFRTSNLALSNHDAPNFERIVIRFIPDGDERMRELETGNIDFAYHAPTYRLAEFDADPGYHVWSYQQPGVCFLNLQTGKGVLENVEVREALTYAVDRDALNAALGGVVTPSYGFLAPAQAGYSAEAQVTYLEADYIKELMRSDEYEIGSRDYEWNDADILYWCFTEDSGYQWDDAELTELLTIARHINDEDERVEAYVAVSERLAEDFKAISLFSDNYLIVSKANVDGLVIAIDDRVWFNDVTKQ